MTQVHAFADDALGQDDAVALSARIKRGACSVDDVLQAAMQRLQQVDPQINAVVEHNLEQARQRAQATAKNGLLYGVPAFIKDNLDLAGYATRMGSDAIAPHPARRDGAVTQQMLSSGLIALGKSRLPEFGLNASTEYMRQPPARNPWHLDYSTGASSGGSAALVAAGVVPIAHANDGGGSIRIPAACCGLVGLKPTRGRLLKQDASKVMPIDLVVDGVVTRSVRDTAYFFAEAERHYRNPKLPALGLVNYPTQTRLRIGVLYDSPIGSQTDAETRHTVKQTALLLERLGHQVEECSLPLTRQFADDFTTYWGMLSFLMMQFGDKILATPVAREQLDSLTHGLASFYRKRALTTPQVIYRLHRAKALYAQVFERYDIVLSPVLAHTTPTLGHLSPQQEFDQLLDRLLSYVSFTPINNITGAPAITVPMGRSTHGLPIGVHLASSDGQERRLLELAYQLEAAQPWQHLYHQPQRE